MVGAGSTALLVDDGAADDEVPSAPPAWSPQARLAAATGVLLLLVGLLVLRPEPDVDLEARGFTARGDAGRSGVVSLAPLDPPTRVAWSADVDAARSSSEVRAAGELVLERTVGGILAVRDAATGEVRWLRRDVAPGTILRVDEVVVTGGPAGLRAFDVADGAERWRQDAPNAEPVPAGDLVLVATGGGVTAIEAATGAIRWALDGPRALDASIRAVVPGGAGIALWLTTPPGLVPGADNVGHHVGLVDPATGELRWRRPIETPYPVLPVAVGARTVAAGGFDGIAVFDVDGDVVHRLPDVFTQQLAGAGELLVTGGPGGPVTGIDLRTGQQRWTRPDVRGGLFTVADGLVLASDGEVIDGETGRSLSSQQRLELSSVTGETDLRYLPAVSGTDLEVRDRGGSTVLRAPLVPDEAPAPAVRAGRVFVPTRDGVEAFGVGDGERDWHYDALPTTARIGGGQATVRTPAVADTTVLVSPGPGRGPGMVALELIGGLRTWDRDGDVPAVRGPLTLAGDVAFVPVGSEIHGYEAPTGRRAFAAATGTPRGTLVVGPNRVIGGPAGDGPVVVDPSGTAAAAEVVAILRRDRSVNWRTPLDPCSGPVLAGDRVAWGTSAGVTALDERTGEPAWELATPGPVCLDPVAARGRIVVVTDPGTLLAVPAAGGGAPLWSTELPVPAVASPVLAGGHLLVPLLDGTLAAYDLEDGTPAWTFELGGVPDASPTVLDGHVLVHLRDGRLLALAP